MDFFLIYFKNIIYSSDVEAEFLAPLFYFIALFFILLQYSVSPHSNMLIYYQCWKQLFCVFLYNL